METSYEVTLLGLIFSNAVCVGLVRYFFLNDIKDKKSEQYKKANKLWIVVGTIYLILSYCGLFLGRLRATSSTAELEKYTAIILISLPVYSVVSSLFVGYRKWWFLLGVIIFIVVTYGVILLLV